MEKGKTGQSEKLLRISFVKMHGAGNDFVLIDDREERFPATAAHIAAIANRPSGIGCDGVILVRRSARADFAMAFFNPDGSAAEMCGNGARCVAVFAREIGAARGDAMLFETGAGDVAAEIVAPGLVRVRMPDPRDLRNNFVNTGVPHCIVPVTDLAAADVAGEGRRIRFSEDFAPGGTNVDFVTYDVPHDVAIRTYERGVEAETGACGTGAVAAAVVGVAQHGLSFPVRVTTVRGDILTIGGRREAGRFTDITLTGPVCCVFAGEIDLRVRHSGIRKENGE